MPAIWTSGRRRRASASMPLLVQAATAARPCHRHVSWTLQLVRCCCASRPLPTRVQGATVRPRRHRASILHRFKRDLSHRCKVTRSNRSMKKIAKQSRNHCSNENSSVSSMNAIWGKLKIRADSGDIRGGIESKIHTRILATKALKQFHESTLKL